MRGNGIGWVPRKALHSIACGCYVAVRPLGSGEARGGVMKHKLLRGEEGDCEARRQAGHTW